MRIKIFQGNPDMDTKERILSIWNQVYPRQICFSEWVAFDAYLCKLEEETHYLLLDEKEDLTGWLAVFSRENERWFVIILHPAAQGKGWGKELLQKAMETEPVLNGWVVDHDEYFLRNGQPYRSPLPFYLNLGFSIVPGVRFEKDGLSSAKVKWAGPENV